MALANSEDKKGTKKKGGIRTRHADVEEKTQHNAELEMQIREEIKRAQEGSSAQAGAGGHEEVEMEDNVDMGEGGTNKNSEFSFVAPHALRNMRENAISGKEPVTPTKVQGNSNFLKRSLDDLSFTPEPPVRKNPRTLHEIKDHPHIDILSKLESLSKIVKSQTAHIVALESRVESQTAHIVALESQVEELSTLSKGNLQANKANRAATKKIETMADLVAAMASITTSPSGPSNPASSSTNIQRLDQQSHTSPSNVNKTNPHLILDLAQCVVSLNERPLKAIREHLQALLKASNQTKEINIRAMSKDNRKDHRYLMFVTSQAQKDILRVHSDEWLFRAFPKAQIQATTLFPIRVDSVSANAILDIDTGRITPQAASSIGEENGGLAIGRIGCLSQPGKKYGSMVVYLKDNVQVDMMLARGFIEVGGESATTQIWEEKGKGEQRYFNCQKQGHLARTCKENTVCGNCAEVGHHHRDCFTVTPKCTKCGGNHRAKDHKSHMSTSPLGTQSARQSNGQVSESSILYSSPSGIVHIFSQNNKPSQISKTGFELEQDHSQMNNAW